MLGILYIFKNFNIYTGSTCWTSNSLIQYRNGINELIFITLIKKTKRYKLI